MYTLTFPAFRRFWFSPWLNLCEIAINDQIGKYQKVIMVIGRDTVFFIHVFYLFIHIFYYKVLCTPHFLLFLWILILIINRNKTMIITIKVRYYSISCWCSESNIPKDISTSGRDISTKNTLEFKTREWGILIILYIHHPKWMWNDFTITLTYFWRIALMTN